MFEALEMRALLAADLPSVASALVGAIHHQDLFTTVLARNDDSSSQLTPLGFTVDFFGREFSGVYVNNNGNVSFNQPLSTFTPFSLLSTEIPLLAPFFADVDTHDPGSDIVRYGQGMIDGRKVFGVNWIDVGYFSGHSDKLNSFQLIITSRSDVAPGDFDFEFNYDAIRWETGDASGGTNGFGGASARAGWSNGTTRSLELPGSAENGALLDNGPNSLVAGSVNSTQPGRYLFEVRAGAVATNPLTVAIGSSRAALASGQTANLSFTLSEPSTTFTGSDVIVTGGTLSNFAGSGVNYSAIFTPQAGFEGVGNVRVATGAFTNARGIPNLAGRLQPALAIDTLVPTVAISSNRTIVRASQTAVITFTLSSPSTTFTVEDVAVAGGTLSNFRAVNGSQTTYTATFTPTPESSGLGTVVVPVGRFTDAAGNVNTAEAVLTPAIQIATNEWVTAIIATRDGQPIDVLKAGQTATLTFTFSEPVVGFTASDVTVTGGTLSGFTGSDKTYTAVFTPRPNSITPGTVRIAANRYTDTLGNPNALLQLSPSIAINTVIPAMTIAQRIPVLKAGQSTTVTFQIRGEVNAAAPFELSDISLAPNQGSVSSLTSLGVNRGIHTYTAVYTAPSGSFGGPVSLSVPANAFRVIGNDFNGNAAASLSINVDAQGPATVLSTTSSALKIGQTATIDFTIANETANVVGFEAGDVTLSSGTISAPTRVTGTNIYRATYTPAVNVEGQVTVTLAAGKFTDAAGNPNSLANSISLAVDTKAPTAPTVSLVSDTGNPGNTTDKITSDARLQTTGTETGATVQYWATSGLTTPWTPAAAVQGSNTVHVTQTDVAGNRSTATAFAFEYRTTGPAVTAITLPTASTGLVAGRFVELKVIFARPVFVTGDSTNRPFIQIGGFTTGEATRRAFYASGSGTSTLVFRYQVQAGDKALTGITYPSSSITLEGATLLDAAGNAASLTFTLPTRRPVTRINA